MTRHDRRTRTGLTPSPRRLPGVLAVLALLACVLPAGAQAYQKAIWGPTTFDGVSQFPIYKDLGVDVYEAAVNWREVAPTRPVHPTDPTDPAYAWSADTDFAVAEAKRTGIAVALMVLRTPAWANGGGEGYVPPTSAYDYAKFVEAVSRRYPSVRTFLVWGEPIRSPNYLIHPGRTAPVNYYTPAGAQPKKLPVLTPAQRVDVGHYAELVDATYARLKRRNRANRIVGGNTTTSGNVDPFNWVRWMRLRDGEPPRMDMFGHNPFGTRGPDLKKNQILPGTADFSDFDVFVPWIDRYLGRAGRNKKLPIFVSEFTAPTDVPSFEFPFHVTRALQATWLRDAFGIAKRFPRIGTVGWIGLRDAPPRADGQESRTGLIDADGVRKPAYQAYKLG